MRPRPSLLDIRSKSPSWVARVLVAGIAVASSVLVNAAPARAVDSVECGPTATVFAAESTGRLWRYQLNTPGTDTASYGARTDTGTGWNAFGRILGGPDGRVYGINSTGMYYYRWSGTGWAIQRRQINSSFTSYATAAYRNKITVDESGDIYLIDGNGRLLRYRYDEATSTWTTFAQLIATGWGQYDLIVAGTTGVLYARTPAGLLFRYRYDPESQRVIQQPTQVGSSWNTFARGIFSVGGDTLFGIRANGEQLQYRYREDIGAWFIHARPVGVGWQNFTNVSAVTNTCRLTVTPNPVRPSTPVVRHTPVAVMQAPPASGAQLGAIQYAFSDNIGRLRYGHQPNVDIGSSIEWSVLPGNHAFTGMPALVQNSQNLVQVVAQHTNSDHWSATRTSQDLPGWQPWANLGGAMKYPPAAVRMPDNTMALFGVDAAGSLWVRTQDGATGPFLPWRSLGSVGAGLVGTPITVEGINGSRTLVAVDAAGTLHTARYTAGTLSAWTSLGGSGFTGAPAVVLMPGFRLRIFARAVTGEIMMRLQEADGTTSGDWSPVGNFTAAGAPAAILDPSGRVAVVARGSDNEVYAVFETGPGSEAWGSWNRINPVTSDPAASDPTVTPVVTGDGESWLIAFRDSNDVVRRYDRQQPASGSAARSSADAPVLFTRQTLPAPPAR